MIGLVIGCDYWHNRRKAEIRSIGDKKHKQLVSVRAGLVVGIGSLEIEIET